MNAADRDAIAHELEGERDRTRQRIEALTRDFDEIVEHSTDAARDDEHDPEGSTIAFERAQVASLIDAAKRHLDDIEVAEARLAADAHGRCEVCGRTIPTERQRARPTARACVDCST